MSRDNAARTTGRELKQSNICQSVDASGLTGTCDRTIRPTSVDELRTALLEAAAIQQRVTVRGAGTGLSGGAVPDGGLLVSLDRLEKKIVIDPQEMQVEVSASVTIAEIEEATRQIGLFYPPDPTEPAASIGGTIATNASGARTFRYGPTARWVDALTLLLVDGDEISLRRREVIASEGSMLLTTKNGREIDVPIPVRPDIDVTKNTAGYQLDDALDAIDLVVGSEGTLGIITSATLRLLERPEKTLSLLIFFSDQHDLLETVDDLRERSRKERIDVPTIGSSNDPEDPFSVRSIEYIDGRSLAQVAEHIAIEIPTAAAGALWVEQETTSVAIEEGERLENWWRYIESMSATTDATIVGLDDRSREVLRDFRHQVPLTAHRIVEQFSMSKIGTDLAVPEAQTGQMLRYYEEAIETSGLPAMIWGHIGNGHLHVNFLPRSKEERSAALVLYRDFAREVIRRGGTVSAEHGIGKIKCVMLAELMGNDSIDELRAVRRPFDPEDRLGCGTMFNSLRAGD